MNSINSFLDMRAFCYYEQNVPCFSASYGISAMKSDHKAGLTGYGLTKQFTHHKCEPCRTAHCIRKQMTIPCIRDWSLFEFIVSLVLHGRKAKSRQPLVREPYRYETADWPIDPPGILHHALACAYVIPFDCSPHIRAGTRALLFAHRRTLFRPCDPEAVRFFVCFLFSDVSRLKTHTHTRNIVDTYRRESLIVHTQFIYHVHVCRTQRFLIANVALQFCWCCY